MTSRLRCHETCPELLKELLRVLGETYEVPELLGEVLGGTGGSSGGPWEVLWAPWEVPWDPLGGSGKVLGGPLGAHRDGLPVGMISLRSRGDINGQPGSLDAHISKVISMFAIHQR